MKTSGPKNITLLLVLIVCAAIVFALGFAIKDNAPSESGQTGGLGERGLSNANENVATSTDKIAEAIMLPEKTTITIHPKVDPWAGATVHVLAKKKYISDLPEYVSVPQYQVFEIACDMEKSSCDTMMTFFNVYKMNPYPDQILDERIRVMPERQVFKIAEAKGIDLSDIDNPKGSFKIDLGVDFGGESKDYMLIDLTNQSVFFCVGCGDISAAEKL